MDYFRKKFPSKSPPATLTNGPPPAPAVYLHPRALAASSSTIALSIASIPRDLSDTALNETEPSNESVWRTAYGMARMAVEIAKESSDMLPPLKAVVGALAVLIKNYDQTTANTEQIKDIEERVQLLAGVLASPVGDQDSAEKARREALRKRLARVIAKLGPLSQKHGLLKFLENVDHVTILNGFVQELAYAVTDYQISIQQSIHETTKRIDEKIDESTKKFHDNTQSIIEASDLALLGKLGPVSSASRQKGHHDTCLRGTRESILDDIMRWAEDPQNRHVFWLSGSVGTGKSTIAQTFAEMVANNGTLGASFFCSRDYPDRKELDKIFPTLAHQLACRYPAFRSQIIRVIKQYPFVAQNSLASQFKDLIVDPLSSAGVSCVIIVDALDECVDHKPTSAILFVLDQFAKQLPPVKFFITGRPELRIRAGFRLPLLEPFTRIFSLHEVKLSSVDEDIRLYLQEKLTAVAKRRSHFNLTDPWPCDEDLTALTKKSSGLFIFASTLVRFIESEYYEPKERLQFILTLPNSTVHEGREGIDVLYTQLLVHGFSDVKEPTLFKDVKRVLGAVTLTFNPLSQAHVAEILNIRLSLVTTTLRHFHSVLLIPDETSEEIRVFHKSFPDFLQDRNRCSDPKFFIACPVHHADMAFGCLELLKKLRPNPCDLPDFVMNRDVANVPDLLKDKVGGALRYACTYWAMHIRLSPTDNYHAIRLIASATEFFKQVLPWIEVLSLESRLEGVIHSIHNLFDWLRTVGVPTFSLCSLAEDCLRFTMHFFYPIHQSAAHIYHSALPLSPESSMFYRAPLPEKTQIAKFYGRPETWGSVLRTIPGIHGGFKCMTVIGHGSAATIAVACGDGTVDVYESVTGVLRFSLKPPHPTQAVTGSPNGSILFCTHRENPSITLWDIQTGRHIHTFTLTTEATNTAVSLKGRYLACSLFGHTVNFWEVANGTEGPQFGNGSPITCLRWLAPEERLMVATGELVEIRDIATGNVLVHSFNMKSPVCDAVYSGEFDQLAVMTSSGANNFITLINVQTGARSVSFKLRERLSCFAFSQTAEVLVCGLETRGLALVSVSPWGLTYFDLPATTASISTLSNGTVVANAEGVGIQLLALDEGYAPSQELIPPALTVHPLDKGRIIAVILANVPTNRHRVILLEMDTMSEVLRIPAQKNLSVPTDHTAVPCASLDKETVVHCYVEGGKAYLQLWSFSSRSPRWTAPVNELPSAGDISPTCTRLATFHYARSRSDIHVWDMDNGRLLARLDVGWSSCPLGVTFSSKEIFHVHHDTRRTTYVIDTSLQSGTPTHSINCREEIPLDGRGRQVKYCVDDGHEWVVRDSQRICWIPPGYIGSDQASYCWAKSSLVMVGRDGTLRKLTFRES